jgi:hypothetical protein
MGQLGLTLVSFTATPGVSFFGRTSTLKIRIGTASVATALGTSTIPGGKKKRKKNGRWARQQSLAKKKNLQVQYEITVVDWKALSY